MKKVADLPVKQIGHFNCQKAESNLFRRPAFWSVFVGVMVVSGAVVATVAAAKQIEISPWAILVFLGAIFLAFTKAMDLGDELKAQREKAFNQYLTTVSPELLKMVATSPEYDQETKDAVIKYLSDAHPGWSLT